MLDIIDNMETSNFIVSRKYQIKNTNMSDPPKNTTKKYQSGDSKSDKMGHCGT